MGKWKADAQLCDENIVHPQPPQTTIVIDIAHSVTQTKGFQDVFFLVFAFRGDQIFLLEVMQVFGGYSWRNP